MKQSAGVLVYRVNGKGPEFFLVHPGGPFWKNRDAGSWSIPKGEFTTEEDAQTAARREFCEETGIELKGRMKKLSVIRQKSGKWIHAFYIKKDFNAASIRSNEFDFEWPPRSGKMISIPEVDRGDWFTIDVAKQKIIPAQIALLDELDTLIGK